MDLNRRKEEFSNAFIQAISATAGFSIQKPSVDDDSVDWTIAQSGGHGLLRSPKLDLQLKSTARIVLEDEDESFSYPLKKKNYDDLRHRNYYTPRILVVVLLPTELEDWISQSDDKLILRHCAYWKSLRGYGESESTSTVSVRMLREHRFTVDALKLMMNKISNKEHL